MSAPVEKKPVIGFSCGDTNGVGIEIIIKTLADSRVLDFCIPVVFANNRSINFYRKSLPDVNFTFSVNREPGRFNPKQVNLVNCWDEEILISPGEMNEAGGNCAVASLMAASEALKNGEIDGLVTAPFHKNNVQRPEFSYTGHTPFLRQFFGAKEVVMLMVAENMRIGLLTEHVPIHDVAQYVTRENLITKLDIIYHSLVKDFGVTKPRIAVLGLNPHAGDGGLVGREDEDVIKPTVKEMRQKGMLCFGPYPADAFFARGQYNSFDAVLAMYHDQGLIPFKSLAFGEGVNYTAGMQAVRTSPDHGTAFDIAGKGIASEASMREAMFTCIDILHARAERMDQVRNPLKKITAAMLRNAVDETIED